MEKSYIFAGNFTESMLWYNIGINAIVNGAKLAARWNPKIQKWVEGRRGLMERISQTISPDDRIVWFHAASLGEFEQGRPVIEALRQHLPEHKILLTFFSPSGYEIRKNYSGADYIMYMPFDTPGCAEEFIRTTNPEIAVFIKYEFWLNHLAALRASSCRTFLISAIFRPNSIFFRPWGGAFRKALGTYETIFVQNETSRELLAGIGVNNVKVAGDTRFDRVARLCDNAPKIDTIEQFRGKQTMVVAGSTWGPDEEIMLNSINAHPEVKWVIAPHEMNDHQIDTLMSRIKGGAIRYTRSDDAELDKYQVMIIDTIGILSAIYSYADMAYVGGGFGAGIHNTLEPATYGIPLAFGPRYGKFREACQLIECGAAKSVASEAEFTEWFDGMLSDKELRAKSGAAAKSYTQSNLGATDMIIREIIDK